MKIEKLLLKKGELPVQDTGKPFVYIPIHPKLLSSDINIDKKLPAKVFPEALDSFMNSSFVKKHPHYIETFKNVEGECRLFHDNGLANTLSIAINGLYFDSDLPFVPSMIKFSKEKMREYASVWYDKNSNSGRGAGYYSKDVGMPVLKLYRDWAILYLNKAMKDNL